MGYSFTDSFTDDVRNSLPAVTVAQVTVIDPPSVPREPWHGVSCTR
jgi:hypothetical protein